MVALCTYPWSHEVTETDLTQSLKVSSEGSSFLSQRFIFKMIVEPAVMYVPRI